MNGPVRRPDETIVEAALKVGAGGITMRDIHQAQAFSHFKDGAVVRMMKDPRRAYVLEHVHPTAHGVPQATIRRAVPKIKGKAARRADRKARRQNRGLL